MRADEMTPQQKEEAARALYERNVIVGPSWDQLGDITKSTWLEDVERNLHLRSAAVAPIPAPAPAPAPTSSALSEFIRNATPERKAEVYGQVMDKVVEQQQEVIERAKAVSPSAQGSLW